MALSRPVCLLSLALAALLPAAQAATAAPSAAVPLPLQPIQLKAMALTFAPAEHSAWIPVARIPGEVDLATGSQFTLAAPHPGTLTGVHAGEGSRIRQGQTLLSIASPAWAVALADANARTARRNSAVRQAGRARALFQEGVISAREMEALQAEAAALEAGSRADQALTASASLTADGNVLVRAPQSGLLLQRASGPGRSIQPGEPLARIGLGQARVVIARAPARLAGQLAPGMRASVGDAVGELDSVAAVIDPASRSITVSAALPATASAVPGALVELAVERAAPAATQRVPASAVVSMGSGDVVFIQHADSIAMVPVQVHFRDERNAWLGGLDAGNRVVARGVLALKAVAESMTANGER